MGAGLPDLPLPGAGGSPFPMAGSVSLGSAVPAPRVFDPADAHGSRACLQRQKICLRSPGGKHEIRAVPEMKSLQAQRFGPLSGEVLAEPAVGLRGTSSGVGCWGPPGPALQPGAGLLHNNLFTRCGVMVLFPQTPVHWL